MKKTITINISGLVFNIEEDAFSALKNYLEKIGNKFNNLEERQEIIEDIEARIAELFTEKLNRNKEVINENDVSQIIEIMGSPDNFEGDETEPQEQTEKKSSSSSNEKKKLFRDGDNKVVAGVCAGVSNYFGWNISVVRTLFALLILLGGTGFWLYIIAWIIIPEAKSVSEKLAMKGKNATVENIEKFVTKFKSDVRNFDTSNVTESFKKNSNKFNDFLVGTSKKVEETLQPKKRINSLFNIIFSIIGFIFISIGTAIILGLIYSLIMPESVNQVKMYVHGLNTRLDLQIKEYLPVAISVFLLALSIGIGFIILGIRFAFAKNKELITKLNPIGVIVRFSIILAFISTLILSALNTKLHFQKYSYNHGQDLFYKTIVIKKLRLPNRYPVKEKIEFNVVETNDEYPRIDIQKSAFGLESNQINSRHVFNYRIEDSIIYLSPTINYEDDFFQDKKIKVTLSIPKNDSINVIDQFSE